MHTHAYAFNVQAPIHCVHHRSHDHRNNKVSHTLAKMYHSSSVIDYTPLLLYVAQKVQMRSDFSSNTKPSFHIALHRSPEFLVQKYRIPSLSLFWCPYRVVMLVDSITVGFSPILYYIQHRSTPVAQLAPRNLLTRWGVSSIPANGIFLTKNKKTKIKMPNGWRTINSLVHKIRLHGRRGKGMAESFSRQKSRHAPQKEGGLKILCDLPPV